MKLCVNDRSPIHAAYRGIIHGAANAFYARNVVAGVYAISPAEYLVCFVTGRGMSDRNLSAFRAVGEAVANSHTLGIARPLVTEICAAAMILYHRIETYARNARLDIMPMERLRNSEVWPDRLRAVSGALRVEGRVSALLEEVLRRTL